MEEPQPELHIQIGDSGEKGEARTHYRALLSPLVNGTVGREGRLAEGKDNVATFPNGVKKAMWEKELLSLIPNSHGFV